MGAGGSTLKSCILMGSVGGKKIVSAPEEAGAGPGIMENDFSVGHVTLLARRLTFAICLSISRDQSTTSCTEPLTSSFPGGTRNPAPTRSVSLR